MMEEEVVKMEMVMLDLGWTVSAGRWVLWPFEEQVFELVYS